jgi:hypothetical protein
MLGTEVLTPVLPIDGPIFPPSSRLPSFSNAILTGSQLLRVLGIHLDNIKIKVTMGLGTFYSYSILFTFTFIF